MWAEFLVEIEFQSTPLMRGETKAFLKVSNG